jgi:hypothetical protein
LQTSCEHIAVAAILRFRQDVRPEIYFEGSRERDLDFAAPHRRRKCGVFRVKVYWAGKKNRLNRKIEPRTVEALQLQGFGRLQARMGEISADSLGFVAKRFGCGQADRLRRWAFRAGYNPAAGGGARMSPELSTDVFGIDGNRNSVWPQGDIPGVVHMNFRNGWRMGLALRRDDEPTADAFEQSFETMPIAELRSKNDRPMSAMVCGERIPRIVCVGSERFAHRMTKPAQTDLCL